MKRVRAKMYTFYDKHSDEYTETLVQYLQERRALTFLGFTLFSYWKTIDTEVVPTFAWIQHATMGSTDWRSKWYDLDCWRE